MYACVVYMHVHVVYMYAHVCTCTQMRTYSNAGNGNDIGEEVASDWLGPSASPTTLPKEGDEWKDPVVAHGLQTQRTHHKVTQSQQCPGASQTRIT